MMKKNRICAMALALLAVFALIAGCETPVHAPPSFGRAQTSAAQGRYIESELALPMPEGADDMTVLGMSPIEGGIEYFALVVDYGQDSIGYQHITAMEDGTVSAEEAAWLRDNLKTIAAGVTVIRGQDGMLYAFWTAYDSVDGEEYTTSPHILVSRDGGITGKELTGDLGSADRLSNLCVLSDGRMVIADMMATNLLVLDQNGNKTGEIECPARNTVMAAHGTKLATIAPSGQAVRVHDLSGSTYEDFAVDLSEAANALAFSPEGALYLCNASGVYRYAPGGTLWEQVVDGGVTTLGIPDYYVSRLYAVQAGANSGLDTLYVRGATISGGESMLCYAFDPEAAQTSEIELNVFSLYDNKMMRSAIVAFHRLRSDIKVNFTVAMQENGGGTEEDYIKALNTELLSGNGPDIILLDGLPVDSYVEKGVLLDLTETFHAAEPLLKNIRSAYEQEGKLYCMPLLVQLPFAFTRAEGAEAPDFSSLSALADNAGLLSKRAFAPDTLSKLVLEYYSDELNSGDEKSVHAFLTQVKRIADATNAAQNEAEELRNATGLPGGGIIVETFEEDTFSPQIEDYLQDKADAILFTSTGLGEWKAWYTTTLKRRRGGALTDIGGRIGAHGLLGVNSASGNREAADAFIKALFSGEIQGASADNGGYPVNETGLDAVMAMENNAMLVSFSYETANGEEEFSTTWPDQAAREELKGLVKGTDMALLHDDAMMKMLLPELEAYIVGDITLEAAAQGISSKLSVYLAE